MTKILCIYDFADMIELVKLILQRRIAHIDCRGAVGGQEGIQAALQEKPDVIIVTYQLPDMTGYDVFRQIRTEDKLSNIPVILVGRPHFRGDIPYGVTWPLKPDVWLERPFVVQDLVDAIERVTKLSRNS